MGLQFRPETNAWQATAAVPPEVLVGHVAKDVDGGSARVAAALELNAVLYSPRQPSESRSPRPTPASRSRRVFKSPSSYSDTMQKIRNRRERRSSTSIGVTESTLASPRTFAVGEPPASGGGNLEPTSTAGLSGTTRDIPLLPPLTPRRTLTRSVTGELNQSEINNTRPAMFDSKRRTLESANYSYPERPRLHPLRTTRSTGSATGDLRVLESRSTENETKKASIRRRRSSAVTLRDAAAIALASSEHATESAGKAYNSAYSDFREDGAFMISQTNMCQTSPRKGRSKIIPPPVGPYQPRGERGVSMPALALSESGVLKENISPTADLASHASRDIDYAARPRSSSLKQNEEVSSPETSNLQPISVMAPALNINGEAHEINMASTSIATVRFGKLGLDDPIPSGNAGELVGNEHPDGSSSETADATMVPLGVRDPRKSAHQLEEIMEELFNSHPEPMTYFEKECHRMDMICEQERLRDEARSKEKERVRKEEQRAEEEKVRTEMQIREAEENKKLEAMSNIGAVSSTMMKLMKWKNKAARNSAEKKATKEQEIEAMKASVVLERQLQAVFESYSQHGKWLPDFISLPVSPQHHGLKGMPVAVFIELCHKCGMHLSKRVTSQDMRHVFSCHCNLNTGRIDDFHKFGEAIASVGELQGWNINRAFQAVRSINKRGLLYINPAVSESDN